MSKLDKLDKLDVIPAFIKARARTLASDYLPETDPAHELIIQTIRHMVSFVESTKIYEITFDDTKSDDLDTPVEIMMGEVLRIGSVRKRYTVPMRAFVVHEKRRRAQEKVRRLNAKFGELKCTVYTTCTAVRDN